MKYEQKIEARRLRKEEGMSIKKIAKKLNVAISSVSIWVRDIELNEEQKQKLIEDNSIYKAVSVGSNIIINNHLNFRKSYQEKGREKAKEKSFFHIVGCMLYWAEGSKRKNSIIFSNSDIDMMKIFLHFIKTEMEVKNEDIIFTIHVYLNNGLTLENIEKYWLNNLDLPHSCLRKSTVNRLPRMSSGKKKNKLIYGVGRLSIHNTKLVQHIFGAIKEYANINDDRWLF